MSEERKYRFELQLSNDIIIKASSKEEAREMICNNLQDYLPPIDSAYVSDGVELK